MTFANFHIHTHFSDGEISPADLLREIYRVEGLDYFAVTDHDSLSAIEPIFRIQKQYKDAGRYLEKQFIPGIELSLREEALDLSIHLLGFFPHMTLQNHRSVLENLDQELGSFCRHRCLNRGVTDLDARIRQAFNVNLENIRDHHPSPDKVIAVLNEKAAAQNASRFKAAGKEGDVIQHPIPITYQIIIDYWEELMPSSSKEKITLYIFRRSSDRIDRLCSIYEEEGLTASEARARAEKNQAVLCQIKRPPLKEWGPHEGLYILKQAGGIAVLAHPAVDHTRISYEDFDRQILQPMIENGLDGIEVYYPYPRSYREEAFHRYGEMASRKGLLISGGTDFHGDGRVGLDDVKLDLKDARRIMRQELEIGP